ncbi:1-phosphatidylinositol 4,5-bisphosphate phosphodiesterase delta-1b isoform X2 [Electrophorus electricus]|uniref:1-phosphatidylinositol 4,5-bisphosphate phosphodiesterase delta-1b isoform X2 n=1 Tax=Electrophorus electricus TaxID=8005 RepID=UPI0015D09E61|nr:1-phosphatidylinositol 4,5-bisphosphate phosphodiesterase delta-1b isoform X2 [Electrophorus electricus]XP_035384357.1 1-phosphatidylinositol 4,5-bisphosphate phosphodiesterase delta-1b isoform X2 [Electrophorus electricus]
MRGESGLFTCTGMEGDSDLQFLLSGADLLKVRSGSWKKTRFYKLQEDCKTMWHESKKALRPRQTFSVEDIECVRSGRQTEGLRKYTEEALETRAFSILFKGRRKNLDLVAASEEEAKHWVSGLQKIISNLNSLSQQQKTEHWIFNCLRKADINGDNKMSQEELKNFLKNINIEVDDDYVKLIFEVCDKSHCGFLELEEIKHFYEILTQREEIDVIYEEYAKTNGLMSAFNLLEFLSKEQKEEVDLAHAVQLIEKYELDEAAREKQLMTKDGFLMYLHQPEGLIMKPSHKGVYQDMTQPLNHYFISSSHNTYLLEDQIKGPSSTEAYIRALMKSCRCLELDVWDGSDGEPVIYHGYTLTSKILFKDVIKAIKEYAFKTSNYPVILSLETHCSVDQQKLMAQHMTTILEDALITKPLGDHMPMELPSPEELKGRFLVKGKRLNRLEALFLDEDTEEEEVVTEEEDSRDDDDEEDAQRNSSKKSKTLNLAKELSDIVIYCKSVKFHGFEHARNNQSFYEISSFKEGDAMKLAEKSGKMETLVRCLDNGHQHMNKTRIKQKENERTRLIVYTTYRDTASLSMIVLFCTANEYILHNEGKLSRIYPSGFRTDSSNYNPVPLWNAGCQIVALNFQTPCTEMDLNQGLFSQNGMCGYVLKPFFLRHRDSEFDPITLNRGPWLKHTEFRVMVISAQQLPKVNPKISSIVDPLVRVQIHGVPADMAEKETDYIVNNGFNPMWNSYFQFDLSVPKLALVRFVVEDYDAVSSNDFIGQCTIPFTSVQNGYRHVPLFNKNGDLLSSAGLFVHTMAVDAE